METHKNSISSLDESDDWFPPFVVENFRPIAVLLLVILSWACASSSVALAVVAVLFGSATRGKPGLAIIGAGIGNVLGGMSGAAIGATMGWLSGWVLELEQKRSKDELINELGWIYGILVGGLAGHAAGDGLQLWIALIVYGFIFSRLAGLVSGFLKFLKNLEA